MEKKTKMYIAGPVSGLTQEEAIRRFLEAEDVLEKDGFDYVNPLRICRWNWSWVRCMAVCIAALKKCDGIMLLPGWKESRGAKLEHRVAKRMAKRKVMVFWYAEE